MSEPEPWTSIYERVKSQIPAAPDPLIRQEVMSTMIDFTGDTNLWLEEIPLIILPNVLTYPFVVDGGRPNRLMLVYNNNPNQDVGAKFRWADGGITMRVPGILQLYNKPNEQKDWVAVISKVASNLRLTGDPNKPTTGYPEAPDWIVDQYSDTIYYGIMYFLQRMASKPFGNPGAAKDSGAQYMSGKAATRSASLRSNVFNAQTWAYPQTFRTVTTKGWA